MKKGLRVKLDYLFMAHLDASNGGTACFYVTANSRAAARRKALLHVVTEFATPKVAWRIHELNQIGLVVK
jgi:hypothetical protein